MESLYLEKQLIFHFSYQRFHKQHFLGCLQTQKHTDADIWIAKIAILAT